MICLDISDKTQFFLGFVGYVLLLTTYSYAIFKGGAILFIQNMVTVVYIFTHLKFGITLLKEGEKVEDGWIKIEETE